MKKILILLLIVTSSFTASRDGLIFHSCGGYLIDHEYYINCYNKEKRIPNWVSYKLTDKMVLLESNQVAIAFKTDTANLDLSPHPKDYSYSGYDRGHLCPAEDMDWSLEASQSTFLMTNVAPQNASFNRGIWKKLENRVRDWAVANNEVYITCGTIINSDCKYIFNGTIAVPGYFYKIILVNKGSESKMIAFIFKNEGSDLPLQQFATTVDEIEKITGNDFYSSLPDTLETKLESTVNLSLWSF